MYQKAVTMFYIYHTKKGVLIAFFMIFHSLRSIFNLFALRFGVLLGQRTQNIFNAFFSCFRPFQAFLSKKKFLGNFDIRHWPCITMLSGQCEHTKGMINITYRTVEHTWYLYDSIAGDFGASWCRVYNITTHGDRKCPIKWKRTRTTIHRGPKDYLCVMVSVKYQSSNTAKYWDEGAAQLLANLYTSGRQFYRFDKEVIIHIIPTAIQLYHFRWQYGFQFTMCVNSTEI